MDIGIKTFLNKWQATLRLRSVQRSLTTEEKAFQHLLCEFESLQADFTQHNTELGMICELVKPVRLQSTYHAVEREIEQLQAKIDILREVADIKDPEQHFEQIMEANKHLQAELERLKNQIRQFERGITTFPKPMETAD